MPLKKSLISLRLDPEVLAWYRSQGAGYQLAIQDVLKRHMARTINPMPGDPAMPAATKPPKKSTKSGKNFAGQQIAGPGEEDLGAFKTAFEGAPGADPLDARDGDSTACGGVYRSVSDARHGDLELEEVWYPLYDTQVQGNLFDVPMGRREECMNNPLAIAFFQNGGARGSAYTNMAIAGQLPWPKRFYIEGVRIAISHIVDISEAYFDLQIGEKLYLKMPLKNMERDDDVIKDAERGPLLPRMRLKHVGITPTIYIPPVQWFGVTIYTGKKHFESAEIRVQLDGRIQREIC